MNIGRIILIALSINAVLPACRSQEVITPPIDDPMSLDLEEGEEMLLPGDPVSRYINGKIPIDGLRTNESVKKHIAKEIRLKKLIVPFPKLTDSAFSELATQDSIEALDLTKTRVTSRTFAQLPKLKNLLYLCLDSTSFDNSDLKSICSLPELRVLYISGTNVTEEGIVDLNNLKKLKFLSLPDTPIKSSTLTHLPKSLIWADLGYSVSGDASHLNHLKHCTHLSLGAQDNKDLDLDGMKLVNLESLNLMPYGEVDYSLISKVLLNNRNIKTLDFRPSEPAVVEQLKKEFKQLKTVNGINVPVERNTNPPK